MRWIGYEDWNVSEIILPGDIALRMQQQHVIDLAASIHKLGDEPTNAPAVNGDTRRLLAGGDRVAAVMLRGLKTVWVHVGRDMTPEDEADVEQDENLHRRRDDRDELIARRVARLAAQIEATPAPALLVAPTKNVGRPKKAETKAREVVAQELHTTPEAIRSAEKRAAAKEEPPEPLAAPVIGVTGLGPVVDDYNYRIDEVTALLGAAHRKVGKLSRHASLPVAAFERVRLELSVATSAMKSARLVETCPLCNSGERLVTATCSLCGDIGFVTEFQLKGLPKPENDEGGF